MTRRRESDRRRRIPEGELDARVAVVRDPLPLANLRSFPVASSRATHHAWLATGGPLLRRLLGAIRTADHARGAGDVAAALTALDQPSTGPRPLLPRPGETRAPSPAGGDSGSRGQLGGGEVVCFQYL